MRSLKIILLCITLCTLAVHATSQLAKSNHVHASQIAWADGGPYPDELDDVVRWKALIGGDAIPGADFFFGELELAPKAIYPGHAHPAPEMYYVVAGKVQWTVGDETFVAEAGTAIYTPPNTMHRMVNLGDDVARTVYAWWAPGGDRSVLASGYRMIEPVPDQAAEARFPPAE